MFTKSKSLISIAALVVSGFVVGPVPANASALTEFENVVTGTVVSQKQGTGSTISVPSATPSDQGTILVTWFGNPDGGACDDGNAPNNGITCTTNARVMDTEGNFISDGVKLDNRAAPDYYGAPYATWNPEDEEWVVFWTTYWGVDGANLPAGESGLYMRRVSADGQPLGDVFALPDQGYNPDTETSFSMADPSNPTLVWMTEQSQWLLAIWSSSPDSVSYLVLDPELNAVTPNGATRIDSTNTPYGIKAVYDSIDGSVGVAYMNSDKTGFIFRDLVISAGVASVSDAIVVGEDDNDFDFVKNGYDMTFMEDKSEFAFSYSAENNSDSSLGLRIATISNGAIPTVSSDVEAVNYGDYSIDTVNRSYIAYDSQTGIMHMAQNVQSAGSFAGAYFQLDADNSLAVLEDPGAGRFGQVVGDGISTDRESSRPILSQTGDSIAFAYTSWDGDTFATSATQNIMAGSLTSYSNTTPSTPAPYSGPLVTKIGSTPGGFTVAEKDTVTVSGQRLSTVSKVVVGGLVGEVISTSANSFEMVVPEGLDPGNYDLEIQSSIGNLTYLGAFVVSSSSVSSQAFGEVTAWTTRVSDTKVKVYVKYPTVGEKVRIGHQVGGNGDYNTVYVKTTASEDDASMIVNENGSYIVRTIELDAMNRIRVTVGEETMVQVRYNN